MVVPRCLFWAPVFLLGRCWRGGLCALPESNFTDQRRQGEASQLRTSPWKLSPSNVPWQRETGTRHMTHTRTKVGSQSRCPQTRKYSFNSRKAISNGPRSHSGGTGARELTFGKTKHTRHLSRVCPYEYTC